MRMSIPVVLAMALFVMGCGSGADRPPLGQVSGVVTYKGKPLGTGTVSFVPVAGQGGTSGQGAIGVIAQDGAYSLTTFEAGDGAILGEHKVVVAAVPESESATADGQMPTFAGPNAYKAPKSLVPKKYTSPETTPLQFTVKAGRQTIDIPLEDR